jgi:membrane protein YdbS with pleckstrin-like domain
VSYVDAQLMSGEKVVYRARLNRIVYASAVIFLILAIGAWVVNVPWLGWGCFAVAVVLGLIALVKVVTSEFVVSDQRVLIKVGWIQRRSLETLLAKIEGIGVEQGLGGRLFGYGTIIVTGTGGTHERFDKIAAPMQFRKRVQEQIAIVQGTRGAPAQQPVLAGREERDCPYCAERILVKAKVCKHCGREVPAGRW